MQAKVAQLQISCIFGFCKFICCLTTGQLPLESSSIHFVVAMCRSLEFPDDRLYEEISRVLKPGGTLVIQKSSHPNEDELVKVEF